MKDLKVTIENKTGRNEMFVDKRTNKPLTRKQVVKKVENGEIEGYIRTVNGAKIPCANPRKRK